FNNEAFDEFLNPALSSVYQPAYEMGKTAAQLLLQAMQQKQGNFKSVSKVLPTKILARASTLT
ncbi:MAG: substrate-binding domain-containing protein, partial [Bacteroidota bacterium]